MTRKSSQAATGEHLNPANGGTYLRDAATGELVRQHHLSGPLDGQRPKPAAPIEAAALQPETPSEA